MAEKLDQMTIFARSNKDWIDDYIARTKDGSSYQDAMDEGYNDAYSQILKKSRPYSYPHGFWTLEVFYKGFTLIPEARVQCLQEPQLHQDRQLMETLGRKERYFMNGRSYWLPVTVTYTACGEDDVGTMLVSDWEELVMVHHATAELTYWLGVDKPERTWTLKDWTVQNFQTSPPGNSAIFSVDLTFLYSEATLTRH